MEITEKKQLRDLLEEDLKNSGLSAAKYARERLGISDAALSRFWKEWNAVNVIGEKTWAAIKGYLDSKRTYRYVFTENVKKVWDVCERAYMTKKAMVVTGEGGYGKTVSLLKFKEKCERDRRMKVYYFDASMTKSRKEFIEGLMCCVDCYEKNAISRQIPLIRKKLEKENALLLIDEVSSLDGSKVVIIKDIMTALRDVCGVVLAGTPYFLKNLNQGKARNGHLFSETSDRIFMLPVSLMPPTAEDAKNIFIQNGISENSPQMAMLMGEYPKPGFERFSWSKKKTFRGISDCLISIRVAMTEFNHGKCSGDIL